ncbi:cell division protein FtsL [Mycoplana dimorpha]|uniref:Uncharacterized protein n=1 Tax=Mycoplana dimorpha TaxID=28320 RepID=A0A2T5AZC0_MYCDI|nr:hypothetical protein [Mycoplana dimorpha]PTM92061.1 hypothetical protein C7449_108108 [Mycoplana dimorpha]
MFRTFDFILIGIMTAAATVTYTIKHKAENKLEEVRKLDAEILLEEHTIDLLRADWALLTQPTRLNHLVKIYEEDLKLAPTESTQIAQPNELPMPTSELPALEPEGGANIAAKGGARTDTITTGSVAR